MTASEPTALVLSAGGARGALQVGAPLALLENGFRPDMLVGVSCGAINATYLAPEPSLERARSLAGVWRRFSKVNLFDHNPLKIAWRILRRKPSFYAARNFDKHLCGYIPPGLNTFNDLSVTQLYLVATDLITGAARIFGDDGTE